MKHAILLLSSYGSDYLNKNIEQFEDNKDIDIYIHIHKKTLEERDKIIIKDNIKFCENIFDTERFSYDMVKAMFYLLKEAKENGDYDYYHYFSDTCFINTSLNNFIKYFEDNKSYSFMTYYDNNKKSILVEDNNICFLYKGSQWISLYKDIVYEILNKEEKINYYEEKYIKKELIISEGALDEIIIHNIILKDIYNYNFEEINKKIKNFNLRYLLFENSQAEYLIYSNIMKYDFVNLKNNLILRKIDFKNEDSWKLLEEIKKLNNFEYNKNIQLWCFIHKNELIEEYNLNKVENIKILNLNDDLPGVNYNKLNKYFSEFAGLYYIWKNNIKSDIVGFCHYRRMYDKINFNKINNNKIQVWEYSANNFWDWINKKENNFIKWCLSFQYPSYIINELINTLSKYKDKNKEEILNDLTNNDLINYYPTRNMFICKWEIFDKIMQIYEDFLFRIFKNLSSEEVEKTFNFSKKFFKEINDATKIKFQLGEHLYWNDNNKNLIFNERVFGYYSECFIGYIIKYFFDCFCETKILYINIDNILNNEKFEDIIYNFYIKNIKNGFYRYVVYSKSNKEFELKNENKYDNRLFKYNPGEQDYIFETKDYLEKHIYVNLYDDKIDYYYEC